MSSEELTPDEYEARLRRRRRRLRTIAILPTLFTLGNLVCGFFSIVVAARVERPTTAVAPQSAAIDRVAIGPLRVPRFDRDDPTHNIMFAVSLIFLATLFDALDGYVARLSKSTSNFGAELDSLADVVTFGVAPAFLLVKMVPRFTFLHTEAVWAIAAWFAVCAALRLARFNAETGEDDDHSTFSGLPAPAAAVSVAGFAMMFYALRRESTTLMYSEQIDAVLQTVLPFFAVLVGFLMVSRIPYPHLVNLLLSGQKSFGHLISLLFAVGAVMVFPNLLVPLCCVVFALGGPVMYVWQEYVQRRPHDEPIF